MSRFIFTTATGRGSGWNREPRGDEFCVEIDRSVCPTFPSEYRRFQYVDGTLGEYSGWTAEEAEKEKARQLDDIAAQRYAIETGGAMFGEYQILTDRESQQILDSAIEKIRRGLAPSISWKCGNGKWLTLDTDNIAAVELTVLSHVQGAFAWEKAELERLGLLE